ncbi:MAG TPA: hypothetical protein VGG85_02420 [Terracidiphilus sp.]|jgi:hypothetical protein
MSLGPAHGFFNGQKTQPDLHLIKQVEQVTMLGWKDRPGALPRFGAWKTGDNSDRCVSNLAIIGTADISLQKTAKQPGAANGDLLAERAARQCY